MAAMRAHAGFWTGVYRHLDADGHEIDRHDSRVEIAFPQDGAVFYRQTNLFRWADGREQRGVFDGVLKDGAVMFDNAAFVGRAWEAGDGAVLLHLDRRDEPGVSFFEIILPPGPDGGRARTWHWYRDGRLIRRTLCDETRFAHTI